MSTVRFVGRRTRGRPQTRLMYVLKEDTERAGVTEEDVRPRWRQTCGSRSS